MIEWWNKNISSCFPIPSSNNDFNTKLNLNFGLNKHNDIYNTNYFFNNLILNDLVFNDLKTIENAVYFNVSLNSLTMYLLLLRVKLFSIRLPGAEFLLIPARRLSKIK